MNKTETRRATLVDTLAFVMAGNAITICKPQRKNKKNPAGFKQSKTKSKRTTGFAPNSIKTNWFFTPKPE